jgi:hypothetical protein
MCTLMHTPVQDMDDAHNLTPLIDAIGLLLWPGLCPVHLYMHVYKGTACNHRNTHWITCRALTASRRGGPKRTSMHVIRATRRNTGGQRARAPAPKCHVRSRRVETAPRPDLPLNLPPHLKGAPNTLLLEYYRISKSTAKAQNGARRQMMRVIKTWPARCT